MTWVAIPAFSDNYIWAIVDSQQGVFDCVDPGDATPVLDFAKQQGLKLRSILLTHHHQDHIGGVRSLLHIFPSCTVYGPVDTRIPGITIPLTKNQTIQVGKYQFTVLFNPGHTATHISYYEVQQGWLFCGDTLFSAGCGRVFDGTIEELYLSLLLFKSLPADTQIFCAHEYTLNNLKFAHTVEPTNTHIIQLISELTHHPSCSLPSTIGRELTINPFLRTDKAEVIAYAQKYGALSNTPLEVFKILRLQKNIF